MDNCRWCGGFLNSNLKIHFILSFKPFIPKTLCDKCESLFTLPSREESCVDCGRFQASQKRCQDCEKWLNQKQQLNNQALYLYHGIIKEYLERYKFKGDYRLHSLFQTRINSLIEADELVIPIPVTKSTMKQRHFNQVTGMLGEIEFLDCLVAKPKAQAQSEKGRNERINAQQPFEINQKLVSKIKSQKVVLIDDVYTTGTTLHYAAQLLRENGAQSVRSITLAR
ncbi:hypothetical protein BGL38_02005 [Fructilactobacillus sanfranciscensis]|nr:hypothetical protein BGL38_02005 [Fructilactobacillus sanfranciscensis]POH17248.1 hypothetical protein BGL43_02005 [Fructilactobacillus sanfranciscensis]